MLLLLSWLRWKLQIYGVCCSYMQSTSNDVLATSSPMAQVGKASLTSTSSKVHLPNSLASATAPSAAMLASDQSQPWLPVSCLWCFSEGKAACRAKTL